MSFFTITSLILLGAFFIVIFLLIRSIFEFSSNSVRFYGNSNGSNSILSHYGFAAIDPKSVPPEEVANAVARCVEIATRLLPYIKAIIENLEYKGLKSVTTKDGVVHIISPVRFVDQFSIRFCLGDSLSGINMKERDVLITRNISGMAIQKVVDDWLEQGNELQDTSIIEGNGYVINLQEKTIALPDGMKIYSSEILSMDMHDDIKKQYIKSFNEREEFPVKIDLTKAEMNSILLSKIRIFNGFIIEDEGSKKTIKIICYRFPTSEKEPVRGSKSHPLSKLNGYVVSHIDYDVAIKEARKDYKIAI